MMTPYKFRPLRDFVDDDLGSVYVAGLIYTVRDGSSSLHAKAQQWIKEGAVEVAESATAAVSGRGVA